MTTPALRRVDGLPERVYRIGRAPDPWAWPDWEYADADHTFGNRFDDPAGEYRVLYAATQREATFRETLARYRPDPEILAAQIDENDQDAPPTAPAGRVPLRWLRTRMIGTGTLTGTFCDLGHQDSLAHLRHALAPRLLHYELDDLDAGDIRVRAPRRFTQEISRYVYEQSHAARAAFAGMRYASRLGDELTNWAVFEDNEIRGQESEPIDRDDPDLRIVLDAYDLVLVEDE